MCIILTPLCCCICPPSYICFIGINSILPTTYGSYAGGTEITLRGEGDVVITLSNLRDADGYTGYTKSVVEGHEILKSFITIYDVNNLSDEELSTIVRHEFGHAIGLGHSTAPEDLMAPNIDMTVPYISECNVDAITDLYSGIQGSTVCEK